MLHTLIVGCRRLVSAYEADLDVKAHIHLVRSHPPRHAGGWMRANEVDCMSVVVWAMSRWGPVRGIRSPSATRLGRGGVVWLAD